MITWLDQHETVLDSDTMVSNDSETIKAQIQRHKDFQRVLGTKQPTFDSVMRMARTHKEKGTKDDAEVFNNMQHTLKIKWNNLCGKSVDR